MSNTSNYYNQLITEYGFSAKGVGWKNESAQLDRFRELKKIIGKSEFTINDLGCGTGAFFDFLAAENCPPLIYRGYDVLEKMIIHAREAHNNTPEAVFKQINNSEEMEPADYTIASGIFNLKYNSSDKEWLEYILKTLQDMHKSSTVGFAFNMLTGYSDPDKIKPELYYADPLFIFDFCVKKFSRKVALLHDYEQYDFTILVKK